MNLVAVISINSLELSPEQVKTSIIPSLVHVCQGNIIDDKCIGRLSKKKFKIYLIITNHSPYNMHKAINMKKFELPYHWNYSLPTKFESVKGNKQQIDLQLIIKQRLRKIVEQAKQPADEQGRKLNFQILVAESQEIHSFISTITKSYMNHFTIKNFKRLPIFAIINELQQLIQFLYEVINKAISLEEKEVNDQIQLCKQEVNI